MSSNVPRRQAEEHYKHGFATVAAPFDPSSGLPVPATGDDAFVEMVDPDGVTMRIPHTIRVASGRLWERYLSKGFRFLKDVSPAEIDRLRRAAAEREARERPVVEKPASHAGALEGELAAAKAELARLRAERDDERDEELASLRRELDALKAAQGKPADQSIAGGANGMGTGAGADAGKKGK